MGKYIIDKLRNKRLDIETGGHWEYLMEYINQKYPAFHTLSDKDKDSWILENFEFKETGLELEGYLDYSYVSEFSDGHKGYKLNAEIRNKNDKEELTNWLQEIATKSIPTFEKLYDIFYKVEEFMRKKNLNAVCIPDYDFEGMLLSFELINGVFTVDFTSRYDENCRCIALFTRKGVNEPLVPKINLQDFFTYFNGLLSYHKEFWEREKEAMLEWVKTLEE